MNCIFRRKIILKSVGQSVSTLPVSKMVPVCDNSDGTLHSLNATSTAVTHRKHQLANGSKLSVYVEQVHALS